MPMMSRSLPKKSISVYGTPKTKTFLLQVNREVCRQEVEELRRKQEELVKAAIKENEERELDVLRKNEERLNRLKKEEEEMRKEREELEQKEMIEAKEKEEKLELENRRGRKL